MEEVCIVGVDPAKRSFGCTARADGRWRRRWCRDYTRLTGPEKGRYFHLSMGRGVVRAYTEQLMALYYR